MHQPGIEPGYVAWKATMIPLHHWCSFCIIYFFEALFILSQQFGVNFAIFFQRFIPLAFLTTLWPHITWPTLKSDADTRTFIDRLFPLFEPRDNWLLYLFTIYNYFRKKTTSTGFEPARANPRVFKTLSLTTRTRCLVLPPRFELGTSWLLVKRSTTELWRRAVRPGIEPGSPAWQAGILTTILTDKNATDGVRTHACFHSRA